MVAPPAQRSAFSSGNVPLSLAPSYGGSAMAPKTLAQQPVPQEDVERKERMVEAWKAYHGEFPRPLKVDKDQPDDNVILNKCGPIVDKGVSFLFGQVLKLECAHQDFITGLWGDDDDKMSLLVKIATNGGITGQPFIKLMPAAPGQKYPRLVNLDPRLIRIVSDPEDYELHWAYIIEYPQTSQWQKRQIIARIDPNNDLEQTGSDDVEDTWTITNYMRRTQDGPLATWVQAGVQELWPYPFPPIVTCQNLPNPNEPWGVPDLPQQLINLNKALNLVESNTARIIKYHAHPKTWGKGFKAGQLNIAVNEVIVLESLDGTLQNLEMHSDLVSSKNFADDLLTRINEQSRIPGIALGTTEPRGNITGVALKQYYQPILEKTQLKQRTYGKLIREITRCSLVLAGLVPVEQVEDYKVDLHWQDILPSDDIAEAQTAQILVGLGVSKATALAKLGYDPVTEAAQKQKEAEQAIAQQQQQIAAGVMPPPQQPQQQAPMQGGKA